MHKQQPFLGDDGHTLHVLPVFPELFMNPPLVAQGRFPPENARGVDIHQVGARVRVDVAPLDKEQIRSRRVRRLNFLPEIPPGFRRKVFVRI